MSRKLYIVILTLFLLAVVGGATAAWFVSRDGGIRKIVIDQVVKNFVGNESRTLLVQRALGYHGKRTYLLLFLNNTELRPSGGFIGAYGIVTFTNGAPVIEKVDGTENLDNAPGAASGIVPPPPLATYLKIKQWQFRDSNWSPDFPTAASTSLAFYRQEQGVFANDVDGIIAFTPTILEELLKLTGPVTVGGEIYTAENAVEKLEYAVEYGYGDKGYTFRDRKQTLAVLVDTVFHKVKFDLLLHWPAYYTLAMRLLEEKHILLYATNTDEQMALVASGWAGNMQRPTSDYLLWADANLGALKTDVAIERRLSYTLTPTSSGFIARATMHYKHTGSFDWRTTRYLDYARVFVPQGSTLLGVESDNPTDPKKKIDMVAQGTEGDYTWFGGFTHIEPGKEGSMMFTYLVAPTVAHAVYNGSYQLVVQKQSGTVAVPLTVGLHFGTPVSSARPAEQPDKYGDSRYDVQTDLRTDKEFSVTF